MAYVVTEPCIGTKDRSCVEVCPVDCFYNFADKGLNDKLGKEPKISGDLGMLVIYEDDSVPEKWKEYVDLNTKVSSDYSQDELDKNRVTAK